MLLYLSTLHGFVMQHLSQLNGKTLSESDMCADCEPDPGECCEINVRDKKKRIEILQ